MKFRLSMEAVGDKEKTSFGEVPKEVLERTRAARERFLQEGAKELNRIGREGLALDDKARRMVTNDKADGRIDFRWSIDTSAEDIYAEIDRALALVHKATSMCQDIYENIWSYYRGRRP